MNRKLGVILSYILMIVEVLSTLLLTPFIIRTLGQAEYGIYRLSSAINAYVLLLDLGIGNAIIRYIAKYKEEKNELQGQRFFGVSLIYYFFIAFIALIIGVILVLIFPNAFSEGLSGSEIVLGQKLLFLTILNSAITLLTAPFTNILLGYGEYGVSKGCAIIQILIRMLLTWISLKVGWGSIGIVVVNLITTMMCKLFYVFYVFHRIKLKPVFKGIDIAFIKEIIIYSSFILLQMIATQINATVDQILIGALVPLSAVVLGVYGVGTQIVQYFQSIGSAFNGVLMPGVVKMVESKASSQELLDEMVRIGRIVLIVTSIIWSGFFVNGKQFICLWAGADNINAYYVALILMSAYVFILVESIGTQILWALNEHKEQAILKIIIVLCNIILTIVLINWNALFGATIGTFISLILGDVVVMNIIFKKKLNISISSYYKELFKGISIAAASAIVAGEVGKQILPDNWLSFVINIIIMIIIYTGGLFMIGMNKYERNLCHSIYRKIIRKNGGK